MGDDVFEVFDVLVFEVLAFVLDEVGDVLGDLVGGALRVLFKLKEFFFFFFSESNFFAEEVGERGDEKDRSETNGVVGDV